jgi:hypothetical protein
MARYKNKPVATHGYLASKETMDMIEVNLPFFSLIRSIYINMKKIPVTSSLCNNTMP